MRRIALLLGLRDVYDHGIARGIIRFARARPEWELDGYGWMFGPIDDIGRWTGDAVIARVADSDTADRLAGSGLPIADVAGAFPGRDFHTVTNDDCATGEIAGEYLVAQGIHHFAFCGMSDVAWSAKRFGGFLRGLGRDSSSVATFDRPLGAWETLGPAPDVAAFVRELTNPVGVFATNDTVALNVILAARQAYPCQTMSPS